MSRPPNAEEPRSKPEIIPPNHAEKGRSRLRVFVGTRGAERVYVGEASPLGIILVTMLTGLFIGLNRCLATAQSSLAI
jgi:hypothetical protein